MKWIISAHLITEIQLKAQHQYSSLSQCISLPELRPVQKRNFKKKKKKSKEKEKNLVQLRQNPSELSSSTGYNLEIEERVEKVSVEVCRWLPRTTFSLILP